MWSDLLTPISSKVRWKQWFRIDFILSGHDSMLHRDAEVTRMERQNTPGISASLQVMTGKQRMKRPAISFTVKIYSARQDLGPIFPRLGTTLPDLLICDALKQPCL